jgi:uncharacterized protein YukE
LGDIYKLEAIKFKKSSKETLKEVHNFNVDLLKFHYELNSDMSLMIQQFSGDDKDKIYEDYAKMKTTISQLIESFQLLSKDIAEVADEISKEIEASDDK